MPALANTNVLANQLEKVDPTLPTLFERDDVFYSTIEKRNVEVISTRDMRIPLELRPGGRFGMFDSDGGDLGRGAGPEFDKAVINTVDFKYGVEWTKKAEWGTDDKRKAIVSTLKHLLAKAMPEFRRNVEALCMTAGDGVVATVTSTSTAGGKDSIVCTTDGFGIKLLRQNNGYSIYNAGLTTRKPFSTLNSYDGYAPIDFYDLENKTVRFDGTTGGAAIVATDKVVVEGTVATPPVSLYGVPYHHNGSSAGTWLGFNRANTPEIRANRVNANGAGLALPFARLALNKIGDRVGASHGYRPVAWMHPCQQQAYESLGQVASIIQKVAREENLNLYFNGNGMQLAGASVKPSFCWDKTRIDYVVKEVWGRAEMHPAKFYDVDGKRIFEIRGTSGGVAARQIFYIVASFNLFVNNPAACSYNDGLAVPDGY